MSYIEQEIQSLIDQGRKVEAVKRVRELTDWGLKEAKDYVDSLARSSSPAMDSALGVSKETLEFEVRELLARGRKIDAIKKVRELTDWGLKEAKDYVDSVEWS
jgi:ribosomal protein L7/L12